MDKLLFILHTILIAFNIVGWAWRKTRLAHLIVLGLTAFSWFVMGAFYGWGFCLCTDWQFRLRRHLGYDVPESSFVQLLIRKCTGVDIGRQPSDILAVSMFAAIVLATAIAWTVQWRRKPARQPTPT